MSIKLELTLPALERLIGGDSEMEVSLRQQIVNEFASRNIKELASQEACRAAMEATRDLVNQIAKDTFGLENLATNAAWPMISNRLRSMIESMVQEHAQTAVDRALLRIIESQNRYWATEVNTAVRKAINMEIDKLVKDGIQQRLDAARNITSEGGA